MRGSRRLWLIVLAVTVSVVASAGLLVHRNSSASSTTVNTTTTTVPKGPWAAPEKGWTVVSVTHRGVALDRRTVWVGGAPFTVARFRKGTVAFHWHAGYVDPPHAIYTLPGDATNHIVWPNEGHVGVLAVFNGGFKLSAHAGGIIHDGQVLAPLIDGLATVAIDANGQMRLGQWGRDLSRTSFPAATYRQNLPLLVSRGLEAPSAVRGDLAAWGSWFGPRPKCLGPHSALTARATPCSSPRCRSSHPIS